MNTLPSAGLIDINGDKPVLVADIGGTSARFALFTVSSMSIEGFTEFECADYDNIDQAITRFLEDHLPENQTSVDSACFAVAGPIAGDMIKLSNNHWQFSIEQLKQQMGFVELKVINDFDAIGYSVGVLKKDEVFQIGSQLPEKGYPAAVLGPGTGFGNSIWLPDFKRVMSTEGGHSGFSPTTDQELAIFDWLIKEGIFASRENLVSGMGIVNIYLALCAVRGIKVEHSNPADIGRVAVEHFRSGSEHICKDTLIQFFDFLANIAGDQAVNCGARGGVYIGGGISKRYLDLIDHQRFRQHFENKGIMRHYNEAIPCYVITAKQPGLLGAGLASTVT